MLALQSFTHGCVDVGARGYVFEWGVLSLDCELREELVWNIFFCWASVYKLWQQTLVPSNLCLISAHSVNMFLSKYYELCLAGIWAALIAPTSKVVLLFLFSDWKKHASTSGISAGTRDFKFKFWFLIKLPLRNGSAKLCPQIFIVYIFADIEKKWGMNNTKGNSSKTHSKYFCYLFLGKNIFNTK